jgi:hypothetical protein
MLIRWLVRFSWVIAVVNEFLLGAWVLNPLLRCLETALKPSRGVMLPLHHSHPQTAYIDIFLSRLLSFVLLSTLYTRDSTLAEGLTIRMSLSILSFYSRLSSLFSIFLPRFACLSLALRMLLF